MKYLRLFENHDDYEASKGELEAPNVAFDCEHVHFLPKGSGPEPKTLVATLMITDFINIYKKDLYDYEDVNISSSLIGEDIEPYMISDDGDFTIYVLVDGDLKYKFNPQRTGELKEEINDDFIEMVKGMGGSDTVLNELRANKGKYIFDSLNVSYRYGFIYDDTNYWYSNTGKEIEGQPVYSYTSEDESTMLYATTFIDKNSGEEISTKLYKSNDEFLYEGTVKTIRKYE